MRAPLGESATEDASSGGTMAIWAAPGCSRVRLIVVACPAMGNKYTEMAKKNLAHVTEMATDGKKNLAQRNLNWAVYLARRSPIGQ